MRLIDADALMRMCWVLPNRMTRETALECFRNIVNEAPTIEAETVRHGQWLNVDVNWQRGYSIAACSECGEKSMAYEAINAIKFCPSCGAKMDGGVTDD